ncbi:MAG: hypothetical protein KDB10_13485 [Acidimicrobiales bacterium]|nr:hypothetical protein [Acidimicrobiales bacterium]MCB9372898.1 hypothetical protein [Microthrixaceae bacterium]
MALVTAGLVTAGIFTPFLSFEGGFEGALIDSDWGATASLTVAALLLVGGIAAFSRPWGAALAAGSALTFLGVAATYLRPVAEVVRFSSEAGGSTSVGAGFVFWCLAAALGLAVVALGLASLGPRQGPVWPFVLSACGVGLLLIGVLVPPDGFSFGELLFLGDGWQDVASVVLLAGLAITAIVVGVGRSPAAAAFALAATAPWIASWLVFAVDDVSGGLPIPFLDAPVAAGLAVTLISMAWLGAALPGATAMGTASGVGATAWSAGQVVVVVLCGGSLLVAAGGTVAATADDGGSFASSPSAVAFGDGEGEIGSDPGAGGGFESGDQGTADDGFIDDFSGSSSGGSGSSFDTEECFEIECEDVIVDEAPDLGPNVLTNVECPSAVAAHIRTDQPGLDPGYLQARYEAGNFSIHLCTGLDGSVYHGENVTNGDRIVLLASGDVVRGFTAYNGAYEYFIDENELLITVDGDFLQRDVVVDYEEF